MSLQYKRYKLPAEWNPLDTSPEEIEQLKSEVVLVNRENEALQHQADLDWKSAIQTATRIFGGSSNVVRYMSNVKVPMHTGSFYPHDIDNIIRDAQKKVQELEREKTRLANEEALKQKQMRAVIWLQEKGLKLGQDFDLDNALFKANDMASDEEIERCKKELKESGAKLSFDGDDSCEDCEGWDGESNRCECGNRRVCWGADGDFEKPYVYGYAH